MTFQGVRPPKKLIWKIIVVLLNSLLIEMPFHAEVLLVNEVSECCSLPESEMYSLVPIFWRWANLPLFNENGSYYIYYMNIFICQLQYMMKHFTHERQLRDNLLTTDRRPGWYSMTFSFFTILRYRDLSSAIVHSGGYPDAIVASGYPPRKSYWCIWQIIPLSQYLDWIS